jgi:hypothetical protein
MFQNIVEKRLGKKQFYKILEEWNEKKEMRIGDVVKNKDGSGTYGTVEYSTFGFSIHFWDEEHNGLGKTLGQPIEEVKNHWEVTELPAGYKIHEYGGVVKERIK